MLVKLYRLPIVGSQVRNHRYADKISYFMNAYKDNNSHVLKNSLNIIFAKRFLQKEKLLKCKYSWHLSSCWKTCLVSIYCVFASLTHCHINHYWLPGGGSGGFAVLKINHSIKECVCQNEIPIITHQLTWSVIIIYIWSFSWLYVSKQSQLTFSLTRQDSKVHSSLIIL